MPTYYHNFKVGDVVVWHNSGWLMLPYPSMTDGGKYIVSRIFPNSHVVEIINDYGKCVSWGTVWLTGLDKEQSNN